MNNNIKGLIFNLDGVLVDTKNIHFESLNLALINNGFKEISYKDHLNIYDGLPTIQKLKLLKKKGLIKIDKFKSISLEKKFHTNKLLKKKLNLIIKFIIHFLNYLRLLRFVLQQMQ